jgi:hypothetical protein
MLRADKLQMPFRKGGMIQNSATTKNQQIQISSFAKLAARKKPVLNVKQEGEFLDKPSSSFVGG